MDRLTRYLFILLGVVVFLVLAPIIVLYISGTRLNLSNRDTTATGILVAKSSPNSADVFVNDQKKDQTPATVRFLDRADYHVRIEKDGFFPWSKTLPVEPGKVTYTYEGVDAVELLRLPAPQTLAATNVTSFVVVDDVVWFSSTNAVSFAALDQPNNITKITLPFTPSSLSVMRNSTFLLAQNSGKKTLVDRSSHKTYALPESLTNATDFNVTTNNFLLARRGDVVYSYNLTTRVVTPLLHNIAGFTLLDNTGYFAFRQDVTTLQTMDWTGTGFSNTEPIINSQLPGNDDVQLIITLHKALFVLTQGNLYRANAPLELISSHVTTAHLDLATDELTFITPSELWFYNFTASKPQLLTRLTTTVNSFVIRSQIGYGFIGTASGLDALEIDNRDQQNRYQLLKDKPVWAIGLSSNQKTVVALQNNQLLLIPIR